MGRSIASRGEPKVSKGERREAGIQWIQPPKAVSDPEFRQTTSGAHGSAGRADCLPRGKPFGAPAGAYPSPPVGIDAPTPAREKGWPSHGALYCSSGDPKGTGGERKAPSAPAGAYPSPPVGLTRRLRRGLGLAVPWGARLLRVAIRRGCRGASGKPPCLHHR